MNIIPLVALHEAPLLIIDGDRGVNYPKKSDFTKGGFCLFLNTSNITRGGFDFSDLDFISKEKDDALRKGKLKRHDIILTTRGTIGNSAYYGIDIPFDHLRINSGMVIIRTDSKGLDPYYFYAFLRSELFSKQTQTQGSGSAQPQLPIGSLKNIQFLLPNLTDQKKIAKVLSTLDAKIELNNRINAELEAMAKLLYDYWFVQFDFPMTAEQATALGQPELEGQPYKTSDGKMVFNKTLKRDIPEGWEDTLVEGILAKEARTNKIPNSEIQLNGALPVIDQSKKFICGFTDNLDAKIEDTPKIVFGDHTRVLKFVNFPFARGADGTQILSANTKRIPQHLFYQMLSSIDLSSYGYARHFKFLKQQKLILPEESISGKFEVVAKSMYQQIANNRNQNQELTELRDWLLPMLMNGQVTVK